MGSAASGAAEEPAQSLLLGDSLSGDIESIVASDIFVDEGLASVVLETDGSGSLLVQGSGLKDNKEISGIESSGIIDSDPTIEGSDVGSAISGESGVIMEGGLSLEGDEVKAWDVDLGEFLNDIEEDPDAATMLGTANDFDLDAEGSSTDDPSQSADLASSQAGDTRGIIDDRLFDDELSIEQISEATKWPALQKSRPEDYAEEFLTASHHRRRSRNPPVLSIAICGVVTFCIVWLACVILLLRYG